jgi:hypothetical protein
MRKTISPVGVLPVDLPSEADRAAGWRGAVVLGVGLALNAPLSVVDRFVAADPLLLFGCFIASRLVVALGASLLVRAPALRATARRVRLAALVYPLLPFLVALPEIAVDLDDRPIDLEALRVGLNTAMCVLDAAFFVAVLYAVVLWLRALDTEASGLVVTGALLCGIILTLNTLLSAEFFPWLIGLLSQGGEATIAGWIIWLFLSFSRHVAVIAGLVRIGVAEREAASRRDD